VHGHPQNVIGDGREIAGQFFPLRLTLTLRVDLSGEIVNFLVQ
jgi:hypothetical protein